MCAPISDSRAGLLYGYRRIAMHFGVTPRTVMNWRARGMPVVAVGIGGRVGIRVNEVEAWVRAG